MDSANKRLSEAMKGRKFSDETKKKMSEAAKSNKNSKGHKVSNETKRKIGEAHINRKDLSKKVLCIETGEVFESSSDVYRKTGINQSSISKVCLGKRKTSGGYHWKFV